MIEIISILGGALTRLGAWGTSYFTAKQENAHELALLDKQVELEKLRGSQKLEELHVQSAIQTEGYWGQALNSAIASSNTPTGNRFIDCINALVRPVLTAYYCIVVYSVYKGFIIAAAVIDGLPAKELASVIATDFDLAVIGSITSYWFVDRTLRKYHGK